MPVLVASLLRRWPLVIALLILGGSVGYTTTAFVPPTYEARSTVLLVPPESADDPGGNRYLLLGGLTPARDIVIQSLTSDSVYRQMVEGTDTTYAVTQDYTTSTPFIVITAVGPTGSSADALRDRLVSEVPHALTSLQDQINTTEAVRITSVEVSHDQPKRAGKTQIRAVIAATGGTLVVGVLLIGLLDRRLLRRRERKAGTAPDGEASDLEDDVPPPVGTTVVEPEDEVEPEPDVEPEPEVEPAPEVEVELPVRAAREVDAFTAPARRDDLTARMGSSHAIPVPVKRRQPRTARAAGKAR